MPIYNSIRNKLTVILISFILLNVLFDDLGIRWSISIFVLLGMITLDCLLKGKLIIKRNAISRYFSYFVAAVLFMYLVFDSRKDLETASYMVVMLVCLFILFFANTDYSQLLTVIRVLIVSGTVISCYVCLTSFFPGIYQIILRFLPQSIREYNVWLLGQGYGVPVGGSIAYADYMISMVIIALFGALLTKQENKLLKSGNGRLLMIVIVSVMLLAMIFEQRRGEPAVLVVTLLLMGFSGFNRDSGSTKSKKILILTAAAIVVVIAFLLIGRFGSASRFVASTATGIAAGDISNGRVHRWNLAYGIFRDNPIFGFGWGRFGNYYGGKSDVVALKNIYKYVHNDYLNVLCETGIIGFLIIYLPLFKILRITLKQIRQLLAQKRRNTLENPWQLFFCYFCLGSQYFWGILAFAEPILYKQMFLFYYTFLLICLKTNVGMLSTNDL